MDQFIRPLPSLRLFDSGKIMHLRVLMLEDNPDDAALIQYTLKKLPFGFEARVVTTRQAFIDAINELQPHIILCDHSLPSMSSVEALEIYNQMQLSIPFILVTGTVSEEFAVNSIKAGADDYILKSNLYRLPSAMLNAIQRRQIHWEKKIAEARYSKAERIAKLGNWEWDLETNDVFWSAEMYRILGFDPEVTKAVYGMYLESVHPEDRALVMDALSKKIETDSEYNIDHRIVRPDGEIRYVNAQADTYRDGQGKTQRFIGTMHDITERKISEHQLDKERKYLQAVLENINVGIIACNPEGEITFFNDALRVINNLPSSDIPYEKWADYFTVYDLETKAPARQSDLPLRKALLTREKIPNTEYHVLPRTGGAARQVYANAQPLFDTEGHMLGAVSAIHDLTNLKQSEEKLKDKIVELDIFIYKASHDLKGPLSSMAGLINLAKQETTDENILKYIDMLEKSNHKLENILKDLFEVAHITQGQITLSRLDLNEVTWDVIHSLKNLPNCNLIKFETSVSFKKDFYSDAKLLRGILQNLIHNSINYRNPDHASFITVKAFEKGNQFVIEVTDNGIGIPEELKSKVFDMFFRGNYSSSGSGLGLYIVKNAVEKLKGRIELQSVYREGSTFTLTLPQSEPQNEAVKAV